MIKVKYPSDSDLETLKDNYYNMFKDLESKWEPHKNLLGGVITLKDLLTGDFKFLVDVYYKYGNITNKQVEKFKKIFDYESHHDEIANFFMDEKNGFDLHTCHYCNMAYINAYGLGMTYSDQLDFVNNASIAEWREIFGESSLPDDKLNEIFNDKPFSNLAEFNKKKYLHKKIELYKGMSLGNDANHFDLDHLLPKSKCPILGLSLFNFVPSCQVCNEKLKGYKEIGKTKKEWLKISPTYSESTFCDDVVIKMMPEKKCSTFFDLQRNKDNYRLEFKTQNVDVYEKYVNTFRLQDRYNYHKELALHILDLKERYPEENRKMISKLLSAKESDNEKYSEAQIKEDIFGQEFNKDRCFSKLRNDMLEHN